VDGEESVVKVIVLFVTDSVTFFFDIPYRRFRWPVELQRVEES
jgi:hypothetical protein